MSRAALCILAALMVVAAGSTAHSVSYFEPPVTYAIAQEAKTVAIADLNGDGRDDLALTSWPSGLSIYYQQSDGTLAPPAELFAPTSPLALAAGDVNGDSRQDLVVGGAGGNIFIYYQQTDGTFALPDVGYGYGMVNSVAVDDLNGDGLADIISTSLSYPMVLVSYQQAGGFVDLPYVYDVGGFEVGSVCTLDLNGDGLRDVAVTAGSSVGLLAGLADGTLDIPQYFGNWPGGLSAGDVTGDGLDDLLFTVPTSQPDAAVGVVSQGAGAVAPQTTAYPAFDYPGPVAAADLDLDGKTDVIVVNSGYAALTAYYQQADGTLSGWSSYDIPYAAGYEPQSLAVGDLNSDGRPDVAIADPWNGLVVLLQKNDAPAPDATAPVCTASVTGTAGNLGWYTSAATVTLSAEDNAGGSGVADVFYSLDGVNWTSYAHPVTVASEGLSTFFYYAVDNAGNKSDVKSVTIKVDTTAPTAAVEPQVKSLWPPTGATVSISVYVAATDAVSGIASLHLAVKDEYGLVQPEYDVTPGTTVPVQLVASRLDTDRDGRVYTLVLTATDVAGNETAVSSTVVVPRSNPDKKQKPTKAK